MEPILGPGGRYRVRFELLQEVGDATFRRKPATGARFQGAECQLLFGEDGTARVTLGENGITLHAINWVKGGQAVLQAEVEAGPGAPSGLPSRSTLRLFEGERQAGAALRDRFTPLPGAAAPEPPQPGALPVDQLLLAVGRSMTRANLALVETRSPGGTALVTTLTIAIAINALSVEGGHVFVSPVTAQGGAGMAGVGQAGAGAAGVGQVGAGQAGAGQGGAGRPTLGAAMAGAGQPTGGPTQPAPTPPIPTQPTAPAPGPPVVFPPATGAAPQAAPQTTGPVSQVTGTQPATGTSGVTSFIQFTLALAPGAPCTPPDP